MRKIELSIRGRVPHHERSWLGLMDKIEATWAGLHRKPLGGRVGLGYLWYCPENLSIEDEANIGVELASRIGFAIKEGARVYIAGARSEMAEPPSKLVLTLEGD